jgi:DNA-binding PadR family transcriptional regulator
MYADQTLTPKEAIRLCALGTLALAPMPYGQLASSIRHFVGHVLGPSLDVMGTSIELLKYEGLVAPADGSGSADDATIAITEAGRRELRSLLTAGIRAAATEFNRLIVALKFRFLHLLEADEQRHQAELLRDALEREIERLAELRSHHAGERGHFVDWLDREIEALESRRGWLTALCGRLAG